MSEGQAPADELVRLSYACSILANAHATDRNQIRDAEQYLINFRKSNKQAADVCMRVLSQSQCQGIHQVLHAHDLSCLQTAIIAAQTLAWLSQHRIDSMANHIPSIIAYLRPAPSSSHDGSAHHHGQCLLPHAIKNQLILAVASFALFNHSANLHESILELSKHLTISDLIRVLSSLTELTDRPAWKKCLKQHDASLSNLFYNDSKLIQLVIAVFDEAWASACAANLLEEALLISETVIKWLMVSSTFDLWVQMKVVAAFIDGLLVSDAGRFNANYLQSCCEGVCAMISCYQNARNSTNDASSSSVDAMSSYLQHAASASDASLKQLLINLSGGIQVEDGPGYVSTIIDGLCSICSMMMDCKLSMVPPELLSSLSQALDILLSQSSSSSSSAELYRRVAEAVFSLSNTNHSLDANGDMSMRMLLHATKHAISASRFPTRTAGHSFDDEDEESTLNDYRRYLRDDLRDACLHGRRWLVQAILAESFLALQSFIQSASDNSGSAVMLHAECYLHATSALAKHILVACSASEARAFADLLTHIRVIRSRGLCRLAVVVIADLIVTDYNAPLVFDDYQTRMVVALLSSMLHQEQTLSSMQRFSNHIAWDTTIPFRTKQDHIGVVSVTKVLPQMLSLMLVDAAVTHQAEANEIAEASAAYYEKVFHESWTALQSASFDYATSTFNHLVEASLSNGLPGKSWTAVALVAILHSIVLMMLQKMRSSRSEHMLSWKSSLIAIEALARGFALLDMRCYGRCRCTIPFTDSLTSLLLDPATLSTAIALDTTTKTSDGTTALMLEALVVLVTAFQSIWSDQQLTVPTRKGFDCHLEFTQSWLIRFLESFLASSTSLHPSCRESIDKLITSILLTDPTNGLPTEVIRDAARTIISQLQPRALNLIPVVFDLRSSTKLASCAIQSIFKWSIAAESKDELSHQHVLMVLDIVNTAAEGQLQNHDFSIAMRSLVEFWLSIVSDHGAWIVLHAQNRLTVALRIMKRYMNAAIVNGSESKLVIESEQESLRLVMRLCKCLQRDQFSNDQKERLDIVNLKAPPCPQHSSIRLQQVRYSRAQPRSHVDNHLNRPDYRCGYVGSDGRPATASLAACSAERTT
jgi:hypothetical protein